MKRLVSGVKPTGDVHIGNYFGAIKQFVDLQNEYESFIFIADFHALNQIHDAKKLPELILEIAKAYLACGIDPQKTILFRQSDVPQVTELCWILSSVTPIGLLQRAHAYKDAKAKGVPINAGLFNYPILMAADILIYGADIVPVGKDQEQHLEITVDIAGNFNRTFGKTFTIPRSGIRQDVATIKGLDGRKMSKSYDNVIGLFDSEKETTKKIMSVVTDSKSVTTPKDPKTCNIFHFHEFFSQSNLDNLRKRYREGSISYKESKEILTENMNNFLRPIREKKKELDANPKLVMEILRDGGEKASAVAEEKLKEVRKKVGVDF